MLCNVAGASLCEFVRGKASLGELSEFRRV